MSLFTELKRRNVFKVAVAYAIVAWLLIQITSIVAPALHLPDWTLTLIILLVTLGFPIALFLAWAYELTPQGIKPTGTFHPEESITNETGRKLNLLIVGLLLGVGIAAGGFWLINQNSTNDEAGDNVKADVQSIPEIEDRVSIDDKITRIEKDTEVGNWEAAYTLAREVEQAASRISSRLADLWPEFTRPYTITSNPAGAHVSRRAYNSTAEWEDLGITPVANVRLPRGLSMLRLELPGYEPVLRSQFTIEYGGKLVRETVTNVSVKLDTRESLPDGMVRVPGWNETIDGKSVALRDFFLGRYEVTNSEFKKFIEAGGYRRREFWQYPILRDGKEIPWDEAMTLFVDRTGRPGPSTWEVGGYPDGQDDYPVDGVSWYEAAAYANFARQELPTMHHWKRAFAAGDINGLAYVMPASNLEGKGPALVGKYHSISWTGAYDMVGNVREWTFNEINGRRFILGGGWNDPFYVGMDTGYAQPPLDRSETNGFRLMSSRDEESVKTTAHLPVSHLRTSNNRDYLKEKPVSDETFNTYRNLFRYDKTPLNASIEAVESTDVWKRERIALDATYNGERMVLYFFTPVNGTPPYQTVVYWPGLAFFLDSINDYPLEDFFIKDGRAIAFPVFKGLFERGDRSPFPDTSTVAWRDINVKWINDLRRSIDYLDTRADVDPEKFSYFGLSWGAGMGPLALALEPRLRAAVLYVGGVYYVGPLSMGDSLPEVDTVNYLPRVKVPVLMLNGEYDSIVPLETSAMPFYKLLGVQEPDKKHVIAPGGHFVPRNVLIKEALDWLDKYTGPVN